MKNLLLKTLTLCVFASGITAFVLHQSGYFSGKGNGAYQGSHNGGALTLSDSLYQLKRDSVKFRILSSSKSTIPIPDAHLEEMIDRRLGKQPATDSLSPLKMLPGSKVYIPVSKETQQLLDTTKKDTIKKE